MNNWKEWFEKYGQSSTAAAEGFIWSSNSSADEMYQAFKARLIEELKVESPELLNHADLVDKPASPRPWY